MDNNNAIENQRQNYRERGAAQELLSVRNNRCLLMLKADRETLAMQFEVVRDISSDMIEASVRSTIVFRTVADGLPASVVVRVPIEEHFQLMEFLYRLAESGQPLDISVWRPEPADAPGDPGRPCATIPVVVAQSA